MEPIVLVGGGELHYRVIQSYEPKAEKQQPIVLVSQNIKVLPTDGIPFILKDKSSVEKWQWDLWTACQRKGIYFLEDQCLSVSRDEQVLHLKKFGRLKFDRLSVESPSHPTLQGQDVSQKTAVIDFTDSYEFIRKMRQFFSEVHRHCPREVRVVFTGFNSLSLRLALAIKNSLVGGSETSDLLIIDESPLPEKGFFKSKKQKDIEKLKKQGIRVLSGALVQQYQDHLLTLNDGTEISFDVLVPLDHWRAEDGLGKILQFDNQKILVHRDLSEVRSPNIFVTGNHVQFERSKQWTSEIEKAELSHVLQHNIFRDSDEPALQCRDRLQYDDFHWSKDWVGRSQKQILQLQKVEVLEPRKQSLQDEMQFQAQHMSRPWQGVYNRDPETRQGNFRLNSFNGFNSWGSYALSAIKITEIAFLKSLSQGVKPQQLRFNLTLPNQDQQLLNHVFESTFRAIESVAEKQGVEIDGGDTFDGTHWHLSVTMGGPSFDRSEQSFCPHDYLIMTRPLGFGFLWAGRLIDRFNSSWIQKSIEQPLLVNADAMKEFLLRWNPSGRVLIEEWGFLFHCLQKLPAHQQLMVNLREVPRWQGTDELINQKVEHPGLDINWARIQGDVAFDRSEVSANNSILWDSMSQGGLVFGVRAHEYQQVLEDLHGMGYERAALVGSIRPKSKGNRVVLSDWSPK